MMHPPHFTTNSLLYVSFFPLSRKPPWFSWWPSSLPLLTIPNHNSATTPSFFPFRPKKEVTQHSNISQLTKTTNQQHVETRKKEKVKIHISLIINKESKTIEKKKECNQQIWNNMDKYQWINPMLLAKKLYHNRILNCYEHKGNGSDATKRRY